MKVREISCGKMHELAIALDKAGFDSDLIQKIINSENNKMAESMFSAIVKKPKQEEKFVLFVDLGTITVLDDYVPETQLSSFSQKNRKKFYGYNDNITDSNFSNPSRVLKHGDKLRVRAFKQVVSGTTTSEERMAFLDAQKAIHTGAHGVTLVFDQKRDQLPKGYWYASFDKKDRLWKDSGGYPRVPYLNAYSVGDFRFDLGYFEAVWHDFNAFLCFSDE